LAREVEVVRGWIASERKEEILGDTKGRVRVFKVYIYHVVQLNWRKR
jgi:hypothetical protein